MAIGSFSIGLALRQLMFEVDQKKKNLGESNPKDARHWAVLYTELEKSFGYYVAYLAPADAESPSEKLG